MKTVLTKQDIDQMERLIFGLVSVKFSAPAVQAKWRELFASARQGSERVVCQDCRFDTQYECKQFETEIPKHFDRSTFYCSLGERNTENGND